MAKKDDDWDLNDLNEDEDDYDDDEEDADGDDDNSDEDAEDSARSKRLIFASLKILVSLALLAAAVRGRQEWEPAAGPGSGMWEEVAADLARETRWEADRAKAAKR